MDKLSDFDIVVPVYNGLTYVKDCLTSIIENSKKFPYHLYLIDDCSDTHTNTYLSETADKHPGITLHRNNKNVGFLKSCNLGISMGKAPYVVLVNSDVIVTPDWLYRLRRCAESDLRIATVNPFTNYAANINLPMTPGSNFYGMDEFLVKNSPRTYPDVVTGVGFCILIRRSSLEEVGLFDEIYERGYCEESDLCMRLTTSGYRTVVADDVYVYHKGCVTFKDRQKQYKKNRRIFNKRWLREYKIQYKRFSNADPLKPARELFSVKQEWYIIPTMRETYRRFRNRLHQDDYIGIILEIFKGICLLSKAKRHIPTPESVARVSRSNRLRITYVLPFLTVAGGVISVVQLVNELILLGIEARIVALREYSEVYDWKLFTRPIIYKNVTEMLRNFPKSDIAVATHWTTARWVYELVKLGKADVNVNFIQDYESWFYPENDHISRAKVKKSYELIPHKIVKSDWLTNMLSSDGHDAVKIRLGLDLSLFYPREIKKASNPIVMAMARPRTPRRGFLYIIEGLRLLKKVNPETEIVLFGDDLTTQNIPFEFKYEGVITDQNRLAELYSAADVFLDGSDFQGFGRTALESMACGTPCVLTNIGGVNEYAQDGKNCLLVPPRKPKLFVKAIIRILYDFQLNQRLIKGGLETVRAYCHKREAIETLKFFRQLKN